MLNNIYDNFKKKSLKQRFLLVISLLNFISFLILGALLLFWDKLQLNLPNSIQGIVGGLIILFGFFRFITQMKRLMAVDDE
jgi:Na+/proline symporter